MGPLLDNKLENGQAALVLADGTVFLGTSIGAPVARAGEVVFNTSLTGYPELLTDPSYKEQLLTLTYTEIGNYGVADRDFEADGLQAAGLIVRAESPLASNWRSDRTLTAWLTSAGVPGIAGVDTRALVQHLRDHGSMMGILSAEAGADVVALAAEAAALPGMAGRDLATLASCDAPYTFDEGMLDDAGEPIAPLAAPERHVVVLDFGVKRNMLRLLVHHGCKVTVVPVGTTAAEMRALNPDGVLLSNGPGDPAQMTDQIGAVRSLLGEVPLFGICMGHQVLSQALGASTYKLAFGHRGGNQPVRLPDGRVAMTAQNHGFAVDTAGTPLSVSHVNVSDGTVEGVDAAAQYAFGVQHHPEAAPGPHDAQGDFAAFVALIDKHRAATV